MIRLTPLGFTLHLDACAVDQQVPRTLRPPTRDVHGKRLLVTAKRAEVRHLAVQADGAHDEPQQAFNKAGRLPQSHAGRALEVTETRRMIAELNRMARAEINHLP